MSQNNDNAKGKQKKTGPAQQASGKGYGQGYQEGQTDARKRQWPLSRFLRKFGL